MRNRTLKDYVWRAYLVTPDQVLDGPPWVDTDRFDINAKSEIWAGRSLTVAALPAHRR